MGNYYCINKIKRNNIIVSYILMDSNGLPHIVDSGNLRYLIRNRKINVTNLRLTNNRLISVRCRM